MASRLTKGQRNEVLKRFEERCAYCGAPLTNETMHVDHKNPMFRNDTDHQVQSMGRIRGSNDFSNLYPACRRCNLWKSTLTVEGFRDHITKSLQRLLRDTPNFKLALDFGLIELNDKYKVMFWFENYEGGDE